MKKVPFVDLSAQYRLLDTPLRKAVWDVFESRRFVLGRWVREFEERAAAELGASHAVGVASGTDAIYLALRALGIGRGDEVITTPFTFFATASPIVRLGAKPVFVDIDPRTFNLDVSRIASKINSRTKAILPVHFAGLPCDMEPLLRLARKRGVALVEDAAQAFGAEYRAKKVGTFGEAGCFSFYPTKNLGAAGGGGMVVTPSSPLARKIRLLRDHGQKRKYLHVLNGVNSRLDELQAAVLAVKLGRVGRWNAERRRHASDYDRAFADLPVQTPCVPKGVKHTYHLYSIRTPRRNELAAFLAKRGIGTGVYYPLPLHLQPCLRFLGHRRGDFPAAEAAAKHTLSLPMYVGLAASAKRAVISAVREFFSS